MSQNPNPNPNIFNLQLIDHNNLLLRINAANGGYSAHKYGIMFLLYIGNNIC